MLIQFILVAVMALALVMTWRRARQQVIRVFEAAAWSLLWIAAAVVVLLPSVTSRVAELVGVGRGVDLVVYASIAGLFLLMFKLFIQHEKLERTLTDLVRREALRDMDHGTWNMEHRGEDKESDSLDMTETVIVADDDMTENDLHGSEC